MPFMPTDAETSLNQGQGEEDAIKVANEAAKILYKWDAKKYRKKKHWFFPSLLAI